MILDATAGGTMMVVDAEQAIRIINALSATDRGDHVTSHFSMPTNTQEEEDWRGNQNGWRQEAAPSNRKPPYQPSHQQVPYPSLHERQKKLEDTLEKFMQVSISNHKNIDASIINLETQVGIGDNLAVAEEVLRETEGGKSEKVIRETQKGDVVQDEEGVATNKDDKRENSDKRKSVIPQLKDLPYPKRPSKKDKERQYDRFLDLFMNLHINIPFMEAVEQMPIYAKFMKDLLIKKRKCPEETLTLKAGCSAIIQKPLSEKTKDSGSFTISVTIGELSVGKTLLDLGAIINLMPISMLKRIGDLEIKPTRMTLQLTNRSVKYPYGVVEDVLVKVDGLVFPMYFVIMDIEEDKEVPLILGRLFMKTSRVIRDGDD
ncbi:PREDICTED: uncharacterized protein LOC109337598 [Lupinus angustifolius]|uniref:uncharacterized protein LOC109337598 n=1 Tax=Lupinus angustifolius TaxID=3871 RepID=UPI00092EF76B|nr:PREDICTED: uncharacterized protein LOC109337598 [Lupinus angustifolius]